MPIRTIYTDTELVGKGLSHRDNVQAINDNFSELSGGGSGPTSIAWTDITNKPTTFAPATHSHTWNDITGKPAVIAAGADAAAARTAIGAGTSNLTIGTTSTTAKAGDYQPTWAQVSGKPAVIASGADAAAARAAIGAGTSNLAIGTTSSTAKAGDYQPTWAQVTGKPATFAPSAHTHTATEVTATAVGGGSATTVQGILEELALRIAALETP